MTWLLDRLRQHAESRPNTVALEADAWRLSYGQLLQAIDLLAERLQQQRIRRLALLGDNSPAWILADLAAHRAGCVVVPVPAFFSNEQREHLFRQAAIDGVYHGDCDWLAKRDSGPLNLHPETAKITFTSGSTGQPKGVCLSHDHQRRTVQALAQRLAPHVGSRHLCVLPLATLLENVAGVYLPLWLGATVVVPTQQALGFAGSSSLDPAQLFQVLNQTRPASLILVPELLRVLIQMADRGLAVPDSLRYIAVGGGRVDPTLLARAQALGLPVYEGYGLSENGSVVALNVPGDNRPGCAGRPLEHVQVRISDHGEIEVAGAVMLGYLGEPAVCGPWATGDLGVFDRDGFLRISGRAKNLLITAYGRNVNPEWLESRLLASDLLRSAVVFGDGEPTLGAVLVPMPGVDHQQLSAAIAGINASLPDYARLSHWVLAAPFTLDNGLATGNGRPRRQAIQHAYQDALLEAAHPSCTLSS